MANSSALPFPIPSGARGRGVPGRRDKGLRVMKHHVSEGVGLSGAEDVVPLDEGTRDCGE